MIGVIATLKAQDGKGPDLLACLKALAEKVNANEDGCLQYDPYVAADDPDTIVMIERYATQEDLAAHGQTDYFKAAGKDMMGFMAGAPDIKVLNQG